ncbi:prepilin-type N-terminal cleavage/methylation domain-containing protein [Microbacterium sp. SS28]|uniref:prepilin-type N-terminal cleavage/methylation domain-containing protein n=1 Tax=Microbacterium sp. SS28 TaxID=2919948 RepID=UPI001FA9E82B|nr:prepilin-type N-terminal cleavage/methylation domain-containing protein [Microbacterium sp. SS28]
MRATIKNSLEAAKARREETGEKGFSLIELIVVIVIIGILAAIAIPIFAGIQKNANDAAAQSAAANGATSAAVTMSQTGKSATDVEGAAGFSTLVTAPDTIDLASPATGTDASKICVVVSYDGGNFGSWGEGPGCIAGTNAGGFGAAK